MEWVTILPILRLPQIQGKYPHSVDRPQLSFLMIQKEVLE